jgi:uncharacterized protein (TIGR02147 family)
MKLNPTLSTLNHLLEAPDYRSFAKLWIEERRKEKKIGYSDIARLGGFSARSFPRDVINGSKRLTLASIPKFAKGLQLKGELSDFFRTLVEIEHEDCRTKISDFVKLQDLKLRLKERILAKHGKTDSNTDEAFKVSSLPEVYAALGSVERGASISEILARTSLSAFEIEAALDQMVASGIAQKKKARYFPRQTHLSFEGLKQSEIFKKHFIWGSERSARMVKTGLSSDSKLFLSSAFSVNQGEIPKLKEELRALLMKFVDTAETTDGNKVVNIVASLF